MIITICICTIIYWHQLIFIRLHHPTKNIPHPHKNKKCPDFEGVLMYGCVGEMAAPVYCGGHVISAS